MGRLTKDDYFRREMNAERRNLKNYDIAVDNGMSEEQADNIVALCRLRHELHTNMDGLVNCMGDCDVMLNELYYVIEDLKNSEDPIVISLSRYETPDDMQIVLECPEDYGAPYSRDDEEWDDWCDSEEYHDWYADNYEVIHDEWDKIHSEIEDYLRKIDKKYHTHFCPTGSQRL